MIEDQYTLIEHSPLLFVLLIIYHMKFNDTSRYTLIKQSDLSINLLHEHNIEHNFEHWEHSIIGKISIIGWSLLLPT